MERPKLRYLEAFPAEISGQRLICMRDPLSYTDKLVFLPEPALFIVSLFDGRHTIVDIQAEYARRFGQLIMSEEIRNLAGQLDEALMLESPRFEGFRKAEEATFRRSTIRPAAHAGTAYERDPERLRDQVAAFFASDGGPGQQSRLTEDSRAPSGLTAVISPHIDPRRGGPCMAWAYRELAEAGLADLYVILGTAHHPTRHLFTLTAKDFDTPFGPAETERTVIEEIVKTYSDRGHPDELYLDEFAHKSEHSIEFQVILLQYLHKVSGGKSPARIVPVLCGSFHELVRRGASPCDFPPFFNFVASLKEVIGRSGLKVCLIAGADLAHIGLRFGDPESPGPETLRRLENEDREMLGHIERLDLAALFQNIRKDLDGRRICGFPCIYTTLSLLDHRSAEGRLLKYQQDFDRQTGSVVTFTSMAFCEKTGSGR